MHHYHQTSGAYLKPTVDRPSPSARTLETNKGYIQSSHLPPSTQHQLFSPQNVYNSRRASANKVSLLRDIGIAGERDKDYLAVSTSSLTSYGELNAFLLHKIIKVYLNN